MSDLSNFIRQIHARSEVERAILVAIIGAALSFITYEIVFWINPFEPQATISWVVSFGIGAIRQHHLHRWISFPDSKARYRLSLSRFFFVSILIASISTASNWLLTQTLDVHHRAAWLICITLVGVLNYLAMKLYIFRDRNL